MRLPFPQQSFFFDIGTMTTRIVTSEKKFLTQESSFVLQDKISREILSIGDETNDIEGKDIPGIQVIKVVQDGMLADPRLFVSMFEHWGIEKKFTFYTQLVRPTAYLSVPTSSTPAYEQTMQDLFGRLGFSASHFIPSVVALADPSTHEPQCIVDIGAGKIDVGYIVDGKVVACSNSCMAGNFLETQLHDHIVRELEVEVSASEIRLLKHTIAGFGKDGETLMVVRGKERRRGQPISLKITREELAKPLTSFLQHVVFLIQSVLLATPTSLLEHLPVNGITLAGGGSLLPGLSNQIESILQIPVHSMNRPLPAVVLGLVDRAKAENDI